MIKLNKSNTSSQCSSESEYAEKYPIIASELITKHFDRADEFLHHITWWLSRLHTADESLKEPFLFRGQKQSYWTILPSALRQDFLCNDMVDTVFEAASYDTVEAARTQYYHLHVTYEEQIIDKFVADCLSEGIGFPSHGNKDEVALLAARTYGLPTRLIDFTLNPAIAAFFAAIEVDGMANINDTVKAVVWSISRSSLDTFLNKPGTFPFGHLRGWQEKSTAYAYGYSEHMRRQKAIVVEDVSVQKRFMETGIFQSLEDVLEPVLARMPDETRIAQPLHNLARFTLPHSECAKIIRSLSNYSISNTSLFPTADKIAEFTESHFTRLNRRIKATAQDIVANKLM